MDFLKKICFCVGISVNVTRGGKMTFLFDIIPMLLQEEFPVLCLVVYLASSMVMESCLKLRHSLSWNSWSVLLGSTVHG